MFWCFSGKKTINKTIISSFEKKKILKSYYLKLTALIAVSIFLMSWGNSGHKKINGNAELSYNSEIQELMTWTQDLISHASDADDRKAWDPDEAPRHYIDIDEYAEFIATGTIPQDIDDAIAAHGYSFVYDAGVLPWATKNTYDSLVNCFARLDWESAMLFASDLGHYVGDGHMPLHITTNYNGQYSNNYGIHSRYESTMINTYGSQIFYEGDEITYITDVQQYIFNYLYANYIYVDSVLLADDYAKSINSNTSSSEYKAALWEKTGAFTTLLFKNASHALAELIYSAWCDANKPYIFSGPFIFTHQKNEPEFLEQNVPNPFSSSTQITYSLPLLNHVSIEVLNLEGKKIATLVDQEEGKGTHSLEWRPSGIREGLYLLVFKSGNTTEIRKMMLVD